MAAAPRSRAARSRAARLAVLAASLALAPAAAAEPPLFAFAQISDIEADEPIEVERFTRVLEAIAAAGGPGALLPHAVAAVFIAGDLVEVTHQESEWQALASTLASGLTAHGIPFLAVPGNHDQDEFGPVLYEQYVADAGVWDVSSAALRGQNGIATATGWTGLRFIGLNNSYAGWNTVSPAELAQVQAIATAAAAAGESVFLVAHHPHDDLGPIPLADVLEIPGVVGYLRGHGGGAHATQGLAGIANPVWDLSGHSVWGGAALIYYEVHATEIRAHVLELVTDPAILPPPAILTLPHPLAPAPAPSAPSAAFAVLPSSGPAPLEVAFADLSANHPTGWLWDFGDGATSSERHPTHTYADPGSYDVSLVASNAQGSGAHTEVAAVDVQPPLPSATFAAAGDTRASSASPEQNFGASTTLRARQDAASTVQSYLRFDVSGLGGRRITRALLRLFVAEPSMEGGTITAAPEGWDESTLTWSNAPGVGSTVLASAAVVHPDTWVEFDVSDLVTGDGSWRFGLSSASSNSVSYSSREGSDPPRLVVFTAPPVPVLGPAATGLLVALIAATGARSLSGRARRSRSFGARAGAASDAAASGAAVRVSRKRATVAARSSSNAAPTSATKARRSGTSSQSALKPQQSLPS